MEGMDLQTVITEHTELDALSHRLERVRRDTLRVNAIAEGTITPPTAYVNRALSRLHEDRAMLTVHMPVITARIAALPASDQDEQVAQALRPLTLAIEQAHLAIARLHRHLDR